jgi:hypothetical protein
MDNTFWNIGQLLGISYFNTKKLDRALFFPSAGGTPTLPQFDITNPKTEIKMKRALFVSAAVIDAVLNSNCIAFLLNYSFGDDAIGAIQDFSKFLETYEPLVGLIPHINSFILLKMVDVDYEDSPRVSGNGPMYDAINNGKYEKLEEFCSSNKLSASTKFRIMRYVLANEEKYCVDGDEKNLAFLTLVSRKTLDVQSIPAMIASCYKLFQERQYIYATKIN